MDEGMQIWLQWESRLKMVVPWTRVVVTDVEKSENSGAI